MLLLVATLGLVVAGFGGLVLLRFPDRPGGQVRLLGIEVSSVGAGLPLIVFGVAITVAVGVAKGQRSDQLQRVGCRFRITGPREGQKIKNRGGATIRGTACNGDAIWIMDYPGGEYYYRENDKPVGVIGERWLQEDKRIGAFADPVGTEYRIVAVRAGRACSGALEAIPRGEDGSVPMVGLPAGCPRLNDVANVRSVVVVKQRS